MITAVALHKFPYHREAVKHTIGMGCIGQLIGQILTRPVFVVLSVTPEPGSRQIVDDPSERTPDSIAVLSIPQCQL